MRGTSSTTVYRYENARGEGPYGVDDSPALKVMRDAHNGALAQTPQEKARVKKRWPGPPYRGKLWDADSDHLRCALISLEAVDRWFAGWHHALRVAGYKVVAYRVPYTMGKEDHVGQVVFSIHRSEKLGEVVM